MKFLRQNRLMVGFSAVPTLTPIPYVTLQSEQVAVLGLESLLVFIVIRNAYGTPHLKGDSTEASTYSQQNPLWYWNSTLKFVIKALKLDDQRQLLSLRP